MAICNQEVFMNGRKISNLENRIDKEFSEALEICPNGTQYCLSNELANLFEELPYSYREELISRYVKLGWTNISVINGHLILE